MKKRSFWSHLMVLVVGFGVVAAPCWGQTPRLFRIGTGGLTGVYYPIGKLIAQGLTPPAGQPDESPAGVPGIIGVAQTSAGSIANVQALVSGQIEAALVQADVAAWAVEARHVFAGNPNVAGIRALASLYPEKLQIVMRKDAGVASVADFRGKRISIDEVGSGTLAVMRIVFDAHGISEADFSPVYLKPAFTQDKIISGEIQGFAIMGGVPLEAVSRLAHIGLTLVPIGADAAGRIASRFAYLAPGTIAADAYPGVAQTPTLQVHALLVVAVTMDQALAHQVTAALFSERTMALLRQGHPQGAAIRLETARNGLSIPLHPGAQQFYQQQGLAPN